ncbi:integrase, catalytic region, zinc finger, CCHC-type containing protein [Tanacetum coccineum]
MDSIIPLGQKNTLAEYMILSGADNRLPILVKDLYDFWKSRMELYIVTKDLWERVQLLMQGTSLTKQERECKLYDAFDKFTHIKGESLHKYYLRFTQLINDMNIYNKKIEQFQVNTKFLNSLPLEWSKFVTDVKLVKDLHTTNFYQLRAYLEQHELHANEVRLLRFVVLVFSPGDDPIACLNKAMAFLTTVTSSSNATSYRGNNTSGQARVVKCYNCQGEGHMARQCTQPKWPRNVAWYKEKAMFAEAQEAGQILDEEQLAFLADPGVPDGQVVQTIIPNNAAFQTKDLDTYDSDYDDISNAKAVLMAKLSNYGSDVISEEKLALKEQVDSLEQNLSKQIKEKECLLQTFTVFKNESKEKENKYIENEIYLEKKIKELDNILFKVGQSAQTVHMLTKPQAFYDNIHKQALGYQNPFHLKKAQRIKPTFYDGIIISDKHVAMPVIDDDETLILE